jgi:hypothetical protein
VQFAYSALGVIAPRTWYDDCGVPEEEPHLVQGMDHTCTGEQPIEIRTQSTYSGGDVVYRYSDLYPEATYTVEVCYFNCVGFLVCQSLWADAQQLHDTTCLEAGWYWEPDGFVVDPAQYADGEFQLVFRHDDSRAPEAPPSGAAVAWIRVEEAFPMLGIRGAEDAAGGDLSSGFHLAPNYPNPFNPRTTIEYSVPRAGFVDLAVFDVSGRRVASLVSGHEAAGMHRVDWVADELPSGVYFFRLEAAGRSLTGKMVLLK